MSAAFFLSFGTQVFSYKFAMQVLIINLNYYEFNFS